MWLGGGGAEGWALVPLNTIQISSIVFGPATGSLGGLDPRSPLFEPEIGALGEATITDVTEPLGLKRSCAWSGLTAGDQPVDTCQVQRPRSR